MRATWTLLCLSAWSCQPTEGDRDGPDTDRDTDRDTDTDTDSDTDTDTDTDTEVDLDGDGWSVASGDCDDTDPSLNPGAEEVCNDGIDNDCDGEPGDCVLRGIRPASRADAKAHLGYATDVHATMEGAGDLDGDGVGELILPYDSGRRLAVFAGPIEGELWEEDAGAFVDGPAGSWLDAGGRDGPSDLDGDGNGELLVAVSSTSGDGPRLVGALFYGPVSGIVDISQADVALEAWTDNDGWRSGDAAWVGGSATTPARSACSSGRTVVRRASTTPTC